MKSALINRNSSFQDVQQLLTGTWGATKSGDWNVVRTPFFTVLTGVLQMGSHVLPVTPTATSILKWANANGSGAIVVHPKQQAVDLPENAAVELILWLSPE